MKAATVIISVDKEKGDWSILEVKSHKDSIETKAYVFDEICRHCDDCSDDRSCKVSFFDDEYGELCVEIVSDQAATILKTMFERDEVGNE